eukprot:COSAG01_NODE_2003_length_8671_cov_9.134858_3_plen_128_part_00
MNVDATVLSVPIVGRPPSLPLLATAEGHVERGVESVPNRDSGTQHTATQHTDLETKQHTSGVAESTNCGQGILGSRQVVVRHARRRFALHTDRRVMSSCVWCASKCLPHMGAGMRMRWGHTAVHAAY